MKSQIVSIFIFMLICSAFLNAEHLMQRVVRIVCIVHNPIVMQNSSCRAKPTNRSTTVLNLRSNVSRPVNNVLMHFQLYKRSEAAYRPTLISKTEDYCLFFKKKNSAVLSLVTPIYFPYSNLNHSCPYFGEVYIADLPLDTEDLPNIFSVGDYRVDISVSNGKTKLITIQVFLEVRVKSNFD